MKNLVAGFPRQLEEALAIGRAAKLAAMPQAPANVYISGLGGSGIGGTIVAEWMTDHANIPVVVGKGYTIPAFVGPSTLYIASSYSGNTEETVACLEAAIQRGAKIVCITSGGKIAELAKQHNLDLILIPGGNPPRACLGYSLTQLVNVLVFHGLLPKDYIEAFEAAVRTLTNDQESIIAEADKISVALHNKVPVIYSTSGNEGVAVRFRQQLNENSKILCWHHVIPEMNHNELVGWTQPHDEIAVVFFRDRDEYIRNDYRIELNKNVIAKYTSHLIDVYAQGKHRAEKALHLIHLGDWISVLLAEKRGVDAVEVNVINHLKGELAKK